MEEADKDWMMIRMMGGWVFLLVPAHPGSPGQRAVKRLLLLLVRWQESIWPVWNLIKLSVRRRKRSCMFLLVDA